MAMETGPKEQRLRIAGFAAQVARGVIREQGMRRKTMFVLLGAAILMLVAGSTVLASTLDTRENAIWFLLFWMACAWLTVTAMLLALFDVLILRRQRRAAERRLAEEIARLQRRP